MVRVKSVSMKDIKSLGLNNFMASRRRVHHSEWRGEEIYDAFLERRGKLSQSLKFEYWLYLSYDHNIQEERARNALLVASAIDLTNNRGKINYFDSLKAAGYALYRVSIDLDLANKLNPEANKLNFSEESYSILQGDLARQQEQLFLMWHFPNEWGEILTQTTKLRNLQHMFIRAKKNRKGRTVLGDAILDCVEKLKQYGLSKEDIL